MATRVAVIGASHWHLIGRDGRREHVRAHTTNVPHYPVLVRDVLRRVREGEPPLASLTDMAAALDLVQDAYALAGPLPSGIGNSAEGATS
jgi:predicted dehydrogenase